jgi:hypothetical protein
VTLDAFGQCDLSPSAGEDLSVDGSDPLAHQPISIPMIHACRRTGETPTDGDDLLGGPWPAAEVEGIPLRLASGDLLILVSKDFEDELAVADADMVAVGEWGTSTDSFVF